MRFYVCTLENEHTIPIAMTIIRSDTNKGCEPEIKATFGLENDVFVASSERNSKRKARPIFEWKPFLFDAYHIGTAFGPFSLQDAHEKVEHLSHIYEHEIKRINSSYRAFYASEIADYRGLIDDSTE